MKIGFRFDIDGTIAQPKWDHPDFRMCTQAYIDAGIVTPEEVASLRRPVHQHLFLLPHVLLTHAPIPGAIKSLQQLAQEQTSFQYVTVRQALDPDVCQLVHANTHSWLEQHHFPAPGDVRFFWDAVEKLRVALEAPEPWVMLIDDRPAGLLEAYQQEAKQNLQQAKEIKERVILVAYGYSTLEQVPTIPDAPRVFPLADWFHLSELLSWIREEFPASSSALQS